MDMDDLRVHDAAPDRAETTQNPVFEGVERAIHEQRLPPGTRLAEAELTEIYGVSRTIVRAGLQALAHAHLVTIRPNRGARVAQPTPEDAREVFEARELIEPRTAFEAARKATAADIAHLRRHSAEEQDALAARQHGRALRLGGAFHVEIARISGQRTLEGFVDELVARSALIISLYWARERVRCDTQCHSRLIDAISRHDADEAESLMRSHLLDIHSALDFGDDSADDTDLRGMLLG
ncbi:GntR family transcriptional regulator [Dinoroseobacter sp. PD6]|nr:GntR family transcriptional regulator [Dinoroseobacter sp. PD6]MDD9718807.1 GntR family transcriptional regulator [Dinoroseobacter sp. PD6]